MKNIFTFILLTAISGINAQVIIGDATGTAPTKTSVLLEFAAGQNKGIIVPYVRTLPTATASTAGTILLDASTATTARVKFSNGSTWVDLSGQDANVTTALATQPTGITETNSKSIIGANTSTADGVLVLESTTKAMVLPIVEDVQNIPSPSPGMMVYVNKSGAKRLAVYNGSKWSFWKSPSEGAFGTVTSATGRIWMDRNLGATQVATSSTDAAAFGDLYQWGRAADGHQLRTTATTTTTLSGTDVPGHGDFIITASFGSIDWRSPQNDNLWQGVNGVNNPCPSGFRLPTEAEFTAEIATFSSPNNAGAFDSPLRLTTGGRRYHDTGLLGVNAGYYWTSTVVSGGSGFVGIDHSVGQASTGRALGFSVRCIKD